MSRLHLNYINCILVVLNLCVWSEPLNSPQPLAGDQTLNLSWWGLWRSIYRVSTLKHGGHLLALQPMMPRHWHTSPRFFFLPQLPPSLAHPAALLFLNAAPDWPHRDPINIFALLKIKKGFVYVYFWWARFSIWGAPLWLLLHAESAPVHLSVWISALHFLLRPHVGLCTFWLRRQMISFWC